MAALTLVSSCQHAGLCLKRHGALGTVEGGRVIEDSSSGPSGFGGHQRLASKAGDGFRSNPLGKNLDASGRCGSAACLDEASPLPEAPAPIVERHRWKT